MGNLASRKERQRMHFEEALKHGHLNMALYPPCLLTSTILTVGHFRMLK